MRRYFYRDGHHIPKHCIYGPRKNEGVIFTPYDWWRVNDHLVRWERDRQSALDLIQNQEEKKQASLNITKNWENTLASIKTQAEEKRRLKKEQLAKERIDKYNEVLDGRKLERQEIMKQAKAVIFDTKDTSRRLITGIIYSRAILEREKQLEFKAHLQKLADEKEAIYAAGVKKDSDAWARERVEEKLQGIEKKKKFKAELEMQMEERRKIAEKEAELAIIEQNQDALFMQVEKDGLAEFDREKRRKQKEFSKRYGQAGPKDIAIRKQMETEEKEEDDINNIYLDFLRRFTQGRKAQEVKMMKESIETRAKIAEKLAQKILASAGKEEARLDALEKEKEQEELRVLAEKEAYRKRLLQEMEEAKLEAQKKEEYKKKVLKEANKWEIIQKMKRNEVNEEFAKFLKVKYRNTLMEARNNYMEQWKEKADRLARDLEEDRRPLVNEAAEMKDLLDYGDIAIKYCRDNNLKTYPVEKVFVELKKENCIWKPEGEKKEREGAEKFLTYTKKPREGPFGDSCYCFKC